MGKQNVQAEKVYCWIIGLCNYCWHLVASLAPSLSCLYEVACWIRSRIVTVSWGSARGNALGFISSLVILIGWFSSNFKFEITSPITPWIVRHEVQLLINSNYNKIREEYDNGINYLTGWYIHSTSELDAEKEPIQVQLARAWWRVLSNYSGMTCATVQLRLKSGLLMTNQIREFWYSYD